MLTDGIKLRNFKKKNKNFIVLRNLNLIVKEKNQLISSLSKNYKDSFNIQLLKKYKKFSNFRIIGIGGSILGTQAIYNFLNTKVKKNFIFIDNLEQNKKKTPQKKIANLIVSKSGNTIETIINSNFYIKKKIKIYLLQKIKVIISWCKKTKSRYCSSQQLYWWKIFCSIRSGYVAS